MDLRPPDAIAAIFETGRAARTCANRLERAGFAAPWTARTEPANPNGSEPAQPAPPADRNDVTETNDGVLGAIGRFFTGEGSSLRRSLEDHGVDPDDATAIDTTIATAAVVLVVDAAGRRDEARSIVHEHGGRIAGATAPVDPALESDAGTAAFNATTDPSVVGARPEPELANVADADVAALEHDEDAAVFRAAQPQRFYERQPEPRAPGGVTSP